MAFRFLFNNTIAAVAEEGGEAGGNGFTMSGLMEKLMEWLAQYGLKVIGAIAIIIIGRFVAGFIRKFIKRLMSGRKIDEALVSFVSSLAYIALMAFVISAALSIPNPA